MTQLVICVVQQYDFSLSAATVVGYVGTAVTAMEHDGVVQLTVVVSVPSQTYEMEQNFSLLVNTLDGTATGVTLCTHSSQ